MKNTKSNPTQIRNQSSCSKLKTEAEKSGGSEWTPAQEHEADEAATRTALLQEAPTKKPDTRQPIDTAERTRNRSLPTGTVLEMLKNSDARLFELAEVVGKWVWLTFTEAPPAKARQVLAQLGFHWNRTRQAWQHPCGKFSLGSKNDPRETYANFYPSDNHPAN